MINLASIVANPGDHPQRLLGALRNYVKEQGISMQALVVRLQVGSFCRIAHILSLIHI